MKSDNEIDNLLGKLTFETPSPDLEERIVSAAFKQEIHQKTLLSIFLQLLAPKPVMTYLLVLVSGVTIGLYAPVFKGNEQQSQEKLELVSDLLYEEVEFI